jgi:hypothetical protein
MFPELCSESRHKHNAGILPLRQALGQNDRILYGESGGFMREGTTYMSNSWLVRFLAVGMVCLSLGLGGTIFGIA